MCFALSWTRLTRAQMVREPDKTLMNPLVILLTNISYHIIIAHCHAVDAPKNVQFMVLCGLCC